MKENSLKLLNGMLSPKSHGLIISRDALTMITEPELKLMKKNVVGIRCDSKCIWFLFNIAIFKIVLKVLEINQCMYTNVQMFFGPGFTEALHAILWYQIKCKIIQIDW